ncbi:MAG: tRNA pseudouridine(38-40) synthase TruA [Bacteroidota bacterium]
MRYFAELAYQGTNYCGWQIQPQQPSVQQTIQDALRTLLRQPIEVAGCGRTDTGVHASQYFIHFDYEGTLHEKFLGRLNRFLPKDIAFYSIRAVKANAHTRFDASRRGYTYIITARKDPFFYPTAYYFPFFEQIDAEKLQAAAQLLMNYEEFFPFCKTNSDAKTMRCSMYQAVWEWQPEQQRLLFHVEANRFLRGMVRLIVGMCLEVSIGKMSLDEVKVALDKQKRLPRSWSVPAQGLFLDKVVYPTALFL